MNGCPKVQLLPATEADYPVVQNLNGYYLYDCTEYFNLPCTESGVFVGCDGMFAAWKAGINYPYLIRVGGELAGYAAVTLDVATREFVIEEFFILRKFRRQGVGKAAAYRLFDQFAGSWRVEFLVANLPARQFWPSVIREYLGAEPLQVDEHDTPTPWGRQQSLRFTCNVTKEFPSSDVHQLLDGELALHLVRTFATDPSRPWLPTYDFEMQVGGEIAGHLSLRARNTFDVLLYFGHLGYAVEPSFQGHHYAERACRLLFPVARSHGLTTLWITNSPDNIASRRTCERLGARLVEVITVPEDNATYHLGDRKSCRYRLDLW